MASEKLYRNTLIVTHQSYSDPLEKNLFKQPPHLLGNCLLLDPPPLGISVGLPWGACMFSGTTQYKVTLRYMIFLQWF